MRKYIAYIPLVFCIAMMAVLMLFSCKEENKKADNKTLINDSTRIVSLNGTLTEILSELGLENKIVGVDITSTYPESIQKISKVGHNRNITSEGVISLRPTLVFGFTDGLKPELLEQFKTANIPVLLFKQETSIEGAKTLIKQMADTLGYADKVQSIYQKIDTALAATVKHENKSKVLFIYARGAGTMMVAGKKTSVDKMIELAGAENAVNDFEDFKPLTAEALVAANPDVILMFNSGLESLGGMDGLLQVQGISQTNAGKNKRVIEMDGQFLTGFGPRLGQAIAELSKQLKNEPAL